MQPIPKKLLIHSVSFAKEEEEDAWGNKILSEVSVISRVRIESSSKLIVTADNRQVTLSMLLFYDCKNSLPQEFVFEIGGFVTFCGLKYRVESVELLYSETKPHHYEIGLSL